MEYYSALKNQGYYEFCWQMVGSRMYHPEPGNPNTEEHAWYVLTDKCVLAKEYRIPRYNPQTI